jgi:Tfp pilus assembly protein PilZ
MQIHFWRHGDPHPTAGYTTNISPTGMFIGTQNPLPRGTRVRVEVLDPQNGFVVEAMVAHAVKVAPALQQVKLSGMGVRFLRIEDLVTDLFRSTGVGWQPVEDGPPKDNVYPVRFRSVSQFLEAFRRDIQTGGLFVPTRFPADVNTIVTVAIYPPDEGIEPVRIPARIVQRLAPQASAPGKSEKPAGMGVAFIDPQSALVQLQPVVARYR